MGFLTIYRIEFTNKEQKSVLVQITDRENYDPLGDNIITYEDLVAYAPGVEIETFNTNEDKYSPILSLRATIRFKSTNQINFSTFSRGEDYRFFVRITVDSSFIFSGWLIMDDNQQAFLPPGQPVTLYATDNLGSLKDIELSDFDGNRPSGKYRLIEIICWCIRKTEGPYPSEGSAIYDGAKVAMNLFEGNHHSTVNNCPLNQTYIDVITTFSKSNGELEDCYTVLNKILFSLGCRLCQYNNYWYILRIDEYKNSAFVVHNYTIGGAYISRTLGATFDKDLDTDDIDFVKAETIQRLQRPGKCAIVTAKYEFPSEIPLNASFTRGDVVDDVLPLKTFNIDDWELRRGFGATLTTPTCEAQIWRRYNATGYESERYAVLTPPASSGGLTNYIRSSPIPICELSKFTFSFDYSADSDNNINGPADITIGAILLYGDDASVWVLGDGSPTSNDDIVPEWKLTNADFSVNGDIYKWFFSSSSGSEDYTEWQSYSIESPPAPVTGDLYIHLYGANQLGSGIDDFAIRYNNIRFTPSLYINGTYKELTGEQFKMSTDLRYTKKYDEQYYLLDAPCGGMKGAMYYNDSGNYYLTEGWIDFALEQYAIPDILDMYYKFLHWQTNAVWNQNRLETKILQASLWGLDVANNYASLIHKYSVLNDLSYTNNNFIILSMRQNWHDCTWLATLASINDITNVRQGGGSSGENFEFKYLEDAQNS